MDSSHSPLRVSVTEQAVGVRTHRPLLAKSVASDGNTQIMGVLLSIYSVRQLGEMTILLTSPTQLTYAPTAGIFG